MIDQKRMTPAYTTEYYTALECKDLQANAMAIDSTGNLVLLAGYVVQNSLPTLYLRLWSESLLLGNNPYQFQQTTIFNNHQGLSLSG